MLSCLGTATSEDVVDLLPLVASDGDDGVAYAASSASPRGRGLGGLGADGGVSPEGSTISSTGTLSKQNQ